MSTTERTVQHTPEPWREGIPGTVVADMPIEGGPGGVNGADAVAYYGGNLIGESMTVANARRIVACVNACEGIPTKALESGVLQEYLQAVHRVMELIDEGHFVEKEPTHMGPILVDEVWKARRKLFPRSEAS